MRYILEGIWSGYTADQRHVVHRTVITRAEKERIEQAGLLDIEFTDGTWLELSIREAGRGEKVTVIRGYDTLICDCLLQGVKRVQDLYERRNNAQ